jgi:L-threonylcarbamoyladenylate synthase
LLRPGQISLAQLADVLGGAPAMPDAGAPRASGTLAAHYAPRTPVALVAPTALQNVLARLAAAQRRVALLHWQPLADSPGEQVTALQVPATAAGYAQALYAGLRTLDAVGAVLIVIEAVPDIAPWEAVNDRLRRAVFDSTGVLERLL